MKPDFFTRTHKSKSDTPPPHVYPDRKLLPKHKIDTDEDSNS